MIGEGQYRGGIGREREGIRERGWREISDEETIYKKLERIDNEKKEKRRNEENSKEKGRQEEGKIRGRKKEDISIFKITSAYLVPRSQ